MVEEVAPALLAAQTASRRLPLDVVKAVLPQAPKLVATSAVDETVNVAALAGCAQTTSAVAPSAAIAVADAKRRGAPAPRCPGNSFVIFSSARSSRRACRQRTVSSKPNQRGRFREPKDHSWTTTTHSTTSVGPARLSGHKRRRGARGRGAASPPAAAGDGPRRVGRRLGRLAAAVCRRPCPRGFSGRQAP